MLATLYAGPVRAEDADDCWNALPDAAAATAMQGQADDLMAAVTKATLLSDDDKAAAQQKYQAYADIGAPYHSGQAPECAELKHLNETLEALGTEQQAIETQVTQANAGPCANYTPDQKDYCDGLAQEIATRKEKYKADVEQAEQEQEDLKAELQKVQGSLSDAGQAFITSATTLTTSMPESAADLVSAFNEAARKVVTATPGNAAANDLNCKAFFQAAMGKLAPNASTLWTDPRLMANDISKRIRANDGGQWEDVSSNSAVDLQKRANRGEVVVAVYFNPGGHGHLAFVTPVPRGIDFDDFPGSGPFVRDGNDHHTKQTAARPRGIVPLGYGAARSSYAFTSTTAPSWFLWKPSAQAASP